MHVLADMHKGMHSWLLRLLNVSYKNQSGLNKTDDCKGVL